MCKGLDLYEPQPYSQAAAIFRKEGASESARSIDYVQRKLAGRRKLRHSGWRRPFIWLSNIFFDLTSGYGLSPIRAFIATLIFILIGGIMTSVANHKGLLIVDALPVVQASSTPEGVSNSLFYISSTAGISAGDMFCGESIHPILYATDIFIPLLDLRQEIRCMIRPNASLFDASLVPSSKGNGYWQILTRFLSPFITQNINIWHWMRSVYSIVGWIMVSLLIYTLSNSLRAKDLNS